MRYADQLARSLFVRHIAEARDNLRAIDALLGVAEQSDDMAVRVSRAITHMRAAVDALAPDETPKRVA